MARILKISLLLLLVGLFHDSSAKVDKNDVQLLRKAVKKLGKLPGIIGQAMEIYEMFESIYDIFSPKNEDGPQDTDERLDILNEKMDQLSKDMESFESRLSDKLDKMDTSNALQTRLTKFFKQIRKLNRYYKHFEKYAKSPSRYRPSDIMNFADNIVNSAEIGATAILQDIHSAFRDVSGKEKTIPSYLLDHTITQEFVCATQQSPQQIIYNLFDTIMLSEVKGFAMLIYSNEILNAIEGVNATANKDDAIEWFNERMEKTFPEVKAAMDKASREIRKCDPKYAPEGKYYARFGPVFQGYAMYESDARTWDENESVHCHNTCTEIKAHKHYCRDDRNCKKRHCSGIIRDCENPGDYIKYCLSDDRYRRYEYVKFDKKTFGPDQTCQRREFIDEFWRDGIYRCDYCWCTCEDTSNTIDKYISLRPVFSDIGENKVITGAKINLKNNIFHIQIQQGVLLKSGHIDPSTLEWKEVDDFSVLDHEVQRNEDYFEISWNERGISLDDVDNVSYPENDYILTGLQFKRTLVHGRPTIKLSTYLSPFKFGKGELNKNNEDRLLNINNEPKSGDPMKLNQLDVPTNCNENNEELYVPNGHIEIFTSDREKDAAQNVLPFIDIQPITSNPPAPLSGAGLFLRGDIKGQCGGYLALKLFTLNYEPYMQMVQKRLNKQMASLDD